MLADFVYHEARLLDEKRFDEWYELFTEDARYWMPLTRGQPEGETHTSLFYEDRLLLKVRIERLRHPNAFSQQQPSFCQHVLQQPAVERADAAADLFVTRTPFMYSRRSSTGNSCWPASCCHHLVLVGRGAAHAAEEDRAAELRRGASRRSRCCSSDMSGLTGTVYEAFSASAARHAHRDFLCIVPDTAARYGIEARATILRRRSESKSSG